MLEALALPPFEPLQTVGLRELSLKTTLLLALASVKRVGDLQALSMNADCMQFGLGDCNITLKPKLGYVPKIALDTVQSASGGAFCFHSRVGGFIGCLIRCCAQYGLCEFTSTARLSFGSPSNYLYALEAATKGQPVSKQRLSHWVVEAISWHIQAREWNVLLVSEPIRRGRLAPCGRGLRAVRSRIFVWRLDGLHRIPSPDFTIWTCGH